MKHKRSALSVTSFPYLDSSSLFEPMANEPWAMYFDSGVQVGSDKAISSSAARYDVLAIHPHTTLVFDGQITRFKTNDIERTLHGDPLAILQSAIPQCEGCNEADKHAYLPGAYGYFSYDLARQYESLPEIAKDEANLPQMAMGVYSVIVMIDHQQHETKLIRLGGQDEALEIEAQWLQRIQELQDEEDVIAFELEREQFFEPERITLKGQNLKASLNLEQYQHAFTRVRDYTLNGDCYQVNLTKQFTADVATDPWPAYCSLRKTSPAPFGCYLNLPFAQVLSNSPESFIQCRDYQVSTSPIKGTRPRDHENTEADKAIALALQLSEKDRAENLMIVDLMRNDLSRVCELGSVAVPELFELHSFANVHHLISKVTGRLEQDKHALDLLRACFPGGSITGAPKIRAMEIIEELEPVRRGLYCGSIGYVGVDGNLETSIAIRTIVIKDKVAYFSAGGGLVIDSEVESEHQELIDKASMMRATVIP